MRLVSWIVVAGSLAWLLYGQLRTHFTDQDLEGVRPDFVRGTLKPSYRGAAPPAVAPHVIAYADIYPQLAAAISSIDEKSVAPAIVQSTLRGVEPGEIHLTLDDGERTHHFPVNRSGRVGLPVRADWRDEKRRIVTNQPEGTLALEVVGAARFGGNADPVPWWTSHPEP